MRKSRKRNKEKVSKEREGNGSQAVGCTEIKGGFGAKELIILPPALSVFQSFSQVYNVSSQFYLSLGSGGSLSSPKGPSAISFSIITAGML